MTTSSQPQLKQRLDSWREIAAFFERDERTVWRWEIERGLPVHRVPGTTRGAVFAYTHELEEWLRSPQKDADGSTPEQEKSVSAHAVVRGEKESVEAAVVRQPAQLLPASIFPLSPYFDSGPPAAGTASQAGRD